MPSAGRAPNSVAAIRSHRRALRYGRVAAHVAQHAAPRAAQVAHQQLRRTDGPRREASGHTLPCPAARRAPDICSTAHLHSGPSPPRADRKRSGLRAAAAAGAAVGAHATTHRRHVAKLKRDQSGSVATTMHGAATRRPRRPRLHAQAHRAVDATRACRRHGRADQGIARARPTEVGCTVLAGHRPRDRPTTDAPQSHRPTVLPFASVSARAEGICTRRAAIHQ